MTPLLGRNVKKDLVCGIRNKFSLQEEERLGRNILTLVRVRSRAKLSNQTKQNTILSFSTQLKSFLTLIP